MEKLLKREAVYLLLEFIPCDIEKENLFYQNWNEKIKRLKQQVSSDRVIDKRTLKDWRNTNSNIPADLYQFLRYNYPVPIPDVLFFSIRYMDKHRTEKQKLLGDLADKWLKDIFSRESFYKRNKEYFTRIEVKYFLSCDWKLPVDNCYNLINYFFNTKIKANSLNLPLDIFYNFRDCFTHQIVIEYFKFLCNNKKYINDKEIKGINDLLKSEYISTGKNIDFKNHTYYGLKRLSDEWYISNMIKNRFGDHYNHKIVQDYCSFCKNVKNARDKEEEIRDICDFLNARINNGQDFNFENMTWRELKQLSDEWHEAIRAQRNELWALESKKKLEAEWKKSSMKDFVYEKRGKTWTIKEITTGKSLSEEGKDMRHCVFTYVERCIQGECFIFSVSCKSGKDGSEKKIATVEISRYRELVQAKGKSNIPIDNETAEIIKIWADENQINYRNYLSGRNQFYGQVA